MTVTEVDSFGAPALKIDTEFGSCVYELEAGGFSSLCDRDGAEWIGFAPGMPVAPVGAANVFRGIANLVFPDNVGHPGYRHCASEWHDGGESVSVRTTSRDGLWRWRWTIDEYGARLAVEEAPADRAYWFLYEGTPAGRFDPESGFWGTANDGRRNGCPPIADPATGSWGLVWFGDEGSPRVLAFDHTSAAGEPSLVGWMAADAGGSDGMVVFGFGRSHDNGVHPHLHGRHSFYLRLVETTADNAIVAAMRQANAHGKPGG